MLLNITEGAKLHMMHNNKRKLNMKNGSNILVINLLDV